MENCKFCSNEAKGMVLHVPLCLSCMYRIDFELKKLITAVKELLREEDDRKEIAELEKRYTKGIAVKGSD